jgi:hypothetical protein
MHVAPGVYAVLVGSGMSSAAGIPTGWQVVQDLVRRIAVAEGVDPDEFGEAPESWWVGQGRPEPRYDRLLPALASTDAARQALLRRYFDPPPSEGGPIQPTAGHEALATLCASGRIRLILTTNFDRLIERALEQAGAAPQVIASPNAAAGMTPLMHSPPTVVKLHGDYAMLGLRNTPEELRSYPPEWKDLLARVFDEFGLLVIGWSAEYDTALGEAMSSAPSRRYPAFWTSFKGILAEPARRLIAQRRATVIDTAGADEFLVDLAQRIRRLDQVAVRRRRPAPLRTWTYAPEPTSVPQGWAVSPLLQLRAVAAISPASLDTCGVLRPQHREALVSALQVAPVTTRLQDLSAAPAASAFREPPNARATITPVPPVDWQPTPGGHQSTEHCSYRLGGDASSGISALVTAEFPHRITSAVLFTIDVGLSLSSPLQLGDASLILRDGLLLTTDTLADVFADILPTDADVTQAEVHFFAPEIRDRIPAPEIPGHPYSRPNDILQRLDLSSLGSPTREVRPSMSFAARLSGPLVEREAADLVVEAVEYVALANGYLDPRDGIALLRHELGLSDQPA